MNANEKLQNAVLAAGRGSRIDLFRLFGKIPGAKNIAVVKLVIYLSFCSFSVCFFFSTFCFVFH